MQKRSPTLPALALCLIAFLLLACSGQTAPAADAPLVSPPPKTTDLRKSAEARFLASMSPPLAEHVKGQPWFAEVTPAEFALVEEIRKADGVAQRYGTEAMLISTLRLAAEQPWVSDGLSDEEAKGITALLRAYEESLTDVYAPDISEAMASSLRGNYFHTLSLPETGEVTLVVASDFDRVGPEAFRLAVETLPKIEAVVGKFPYTFLFIWVTDIGDLIAGLSRDEFILLSPDYVEPGTMAHEITHATMYGLFPEWFEEGFAYFVEAHATGAIEAKTAESKAVLAQLKRQVKLDLRGKFDHSFSGYIENSAQGFLFFKGLYDIEGVDGLGRIVRGLRSATHTNDNELLRQIVSLGLPENQARLQAYLCTGVIGLRSGC